RPPSSPLSPYTTLFRSLHRRAGRVQRVLHPRLLLLDRRLGRGADLDHRHAAGELRQALLQLLAVVVRSRLLDLRPDLLDPPLDRSEEHTSELQSRFDLV